MDLYNPKMEIRELPTKIYKELCSLLDIPGEKDWKALVSVLPDGIYSKSQVFCELQHFFINYFKIHRH